MKSPCEKNCPDRSPTCHGECEKYLEYYAHRRKIDKAKLGDETIGYLKDIHKKRKARWEYNNK